MSGGVNFLFLAAAANAGRVRPKGQQAGDARAGAADREILQRLADPHDENDFGRHEEPARRIRAAPPKPEGGHRRQADRQIGGDLAVQQAGGGGRIGGEPANQRQQHGQIEIVDRSAVAGHIGGQSRSHGQREQPVAAVRIAKETGGEKHQALAPENVVAVESIAVNHRNVRHSERSEESSLCCGSGRILRCAQNDGVARGSNR